MIGSVVLGAICTAVGIWTGIQFGKSHYGWRLTEARQRIAYLEKKNSELEDSVEFWSYDYLDKAEQCKALYEELRKYKRAYNELIHEVGSKGDIDEDIREAIKFAMTNAHPDKPSGSQDKFIKFHKLFKKHCK